MYSDPHARTVAPPGLVPQDVWERWQEEQAGAQRSPALTADPAPLLPPGLLATVPADFEVALFGLSQLPLFADLDRTALSALAAHARQGELQDGGYLFREDTWATSFYVVLEGAVEVLRRLPETGREIALRHVEKDEPVGLFGLFCGQRRAACARAIGDVILLEVPAPALVSALTDHPALRERMARFYRERLVEGFVGASRLFSDVDPIARARIIGRFKGRRLAAGQALVNPGEVQNLFALVLDGALQLETRPVPGKAPGRYVLSTGEFLALTCAFSGAPAQWRIVASEETDLALLGHAEVTALVRDYPALRSVVVRLPTLSQRLGQDVWCGHCAVPGL